MTCEDKPTLPEFAIDLELTEDEFDWLLLFVESSERGERPYPLPSSQRPMLQHLARKLKAQKLLAASKRPKEGA